MAPKKEINPNDHSRAAIKAAKAGPGKEATKSILDPTALKDAKAERQAKKAEKEARDAEKAKKLEAKELKDKKAAEKIAKEEAKAKGK
eukprot:gene7067-8429_t